MQVIDCTIDCIDGEVPVFRLGNTKKKATIEPKTFVVKVREDVVPRVNTAVQQAVERSAPARAEAKARTSAAWHALRGEYIVTPAKKRGKLPGVLIGVVGAAAAAGAAAWAALRQSRPPEWVTPAEEESADSMSSASATEPPVGAPRTSRSRSKPTSEDQAGSSPDEVLADIADTSRDGMGNR